MGDPALEALFYDPFNKLKGSEKAKITSRYQEEVDRQLKIAVEEIIDVDKTYGFKLSSPQARRSQLEAELKTFLEFRELSQQLTVAFKILAKCKKYIESPLAYYMMIGEFAKALTHLDHVEVGKIFELNLQLLLEISDETMSSLTAIAIAKYVEEDYVESFAIYTLLSVLAPENPNYWYRVGITAQKCDKYELAIKTYAMTCLFDPQNIGARVFASECYLILEALNDAEIEYTEAKKILESLTVEKRSEEAINLLANLEILIKHNVFSRR